MSELDQDQARQLCWMVGKLRWKLKSHQRRMYEMYRATNHRKVVFHCSRRIGKSYTLLTIANETAIRKPGAQIRYAAPTQKNVKEIILPVMRELLHDCPNEVRPEWKGQDGHFVYPNGSVLSIAGTDGGNADKLRGSACDLGIVDEAGFVDELKYLVRSILMPQFITTNGRMILSSSSPVSPAHDFVGFMAEAEAADAMVRITIHEDSRPEVIARIPEWTKESGGAESTDWRREYLCELVTDETRAIVPEFDDAAAKALVTEAVRPPYFDSYVAMDVGFNDLTAVLFGYWDFRRAVLVVEDELALSRMTTDDLAHGIRAKEASLSWPRGPLMRVSDTDLIVINDLNRLHNLGFIATQKDDKEAAINAVRMLVGEGKLAIHPRCKNLIAHLKYGIWNKHRTQFERAEGFGHFDFVDALVYLVRNVRREKNPYPHLLGMSEYTHDIPEDMQPLAASSDVRRAFGR